MKQNKQNKTKLIVCKRCGHKWNYKGKKLLRTDNYPKYIGCPNCKTSIKIDQIIYKKKAFLFYTKL